VIKQKRLLIEELTGVNSSKLNYYVELKMRNEEIILQNNRLELLHQIVKDINIDMSIKDIIYRTYSKLPHVLPCDMLSLALLEEGVLRFIAMYPYKECSKKIVPKNSFLWQCIQNKENQLLHLSEDNKNVFTEICGSKMLKENNISSLITIPLLARGNVIGALAIGAEEHMAYSESELRFCRHLADQLAICIENARLYEQVLRKKIEWEETFNAVIDPIYLIDLDFNIVQSNKRNLPFSNFINNGSNQKKCFQLLRGRDNKCNPCLIEKVVQTGKPAYRQVQANGYVFDVSYYPVFNKEDQLYAVLHHIHDITEKVKMEAKLIHSAKLAAIGEMAAGVAHELNSPMTVIIGTAQMLLEQLDQDNPQVEYMKDIANCGLRCKRIIQNLLTFSRQEQKPLEPTDLNDQIDTVLNLTKYQINSSSIKLQMNLTDKLPKIHANPQQLQQVLINLLLNAKDALENNKNEKCIEISTGIMGNDSGEQKVYLAVTDNGEGIDEKRIDKIFDPFYTSKTSTKGTGLGLSVSLGIAQAHGGTIKVKSSLGKGSSFYLILPVT